MADRSGVPARTCGRNLARRSIGLGLQLGNYAGVGARDPHVSPSKATPKDPAGTGKVPSTAPSPAATSSDCRCLLWVANT